PEPYHTSALSRQGWVDELLNGHQSQIRTELSIHKHVFLRLISILQEASHQQNCLPLSTAVQPVTACYSSDSMTGKSPPV
ncbi:hypothetical protein PISMIDRAFT_112904, partial [Pisolithus microcarpus 441]